MDKISDELFQFAFELLHATIESVDINEKSLIISFDSVYIHKYFGKIEFGIGQSFTTQGEMVLRDVTIHGDAPQYPARIVDLSFVENGSIFGNYIDYPFSASGDVQLVITFDNHEKITITSSKAFMMIKDLDKNISNNQ